jgi:hypothetical protein
MLPGGTKPVVSLCRGIEMSLCFYTAVDDIREAATQHRLPGSRKKLLWATILRQVAKQDACDGSLADQQSWISVFNEGKVLCIEPLVITTNAGR